MKIIKSILDRPYLLILVAFLITIMPLREYVFYSIIFIVIIFGISILYTIIQKKWLRLFFSILCYFAFFISWAVIIFFRGFSEEFKPVKEIGDSKFYSQEILKTTQLGIADELKIISKLDTIVYVGIEDEYDAECLYEGPSKLIKVLESAIISDKEFSKVDKLDNYPSKVVNQQNFRLTDIKAIYRKESQGRYIVHVAFNKSRTKLYYTVS
jgi:energy-coupling factor transporter transmembrane protein EcfT